jgi:hypothetical protein
MVWELAASRPAATAASALALETPSLPANEVAECCSDVSVIKLFWSALHFGGAVNCDSRDRGLEIFQQHLRATVELALQGSLVESGTTSSGFGNESFNSRCQDLPDADSIFEYLSRADLVFALDLESDLGK